PLAGSYYVESLTNELERRATELMAKVAELGGAERAIAAGFFQEEIARSAYEHQLRVESGETVIVGLNRFTDDAAAPRIPTPDYSALERAQAEKLRAVRARRDAARVAAVLAQLEKAAGAYASEERTREPLMPLIVEAVRARASVGEIAETLAARWGRYRPTS
ncbi:MAG TPA: methylmalonyl-CoA mutase family protein, partial [Gemmatimonadaceae bacterium]|nr:methylmalonyl-CoA mutase family protein [Gemmatimonadaceae bacterium]